MVFGMGVSVLLEFTNETEFQLERFSCRPFILTYALFAASDGLYQQNKYPPPPPDTQFYTGNMKLVPGILG